MNRIYKILLLVIIPLLIAIGVGVYSYYRYQNYFYTYYLDSAKYKDTEDLLNRYLMYNDTYFQEYLKEDIKNSEGKSLFTLSCVREFDETESEDDEDEVVTTMKYTFFIYNVQYENVYRTIPGYSDTKAHKFNSYLPTFKLTITDANDEDNIIEVTFETNTNYTFKDYNFKGVGDTQKWQDGSKITTAYVKWASIDTSEYTITENVNITIEAIDSQYPSEEDGNNFEAYNVDKTDFFTSYKKLDTENNKYDDKDVTVAYNGDVKKAGYFKYVFTKWMWWECLIGFGLAFIITGSTFVIWQDNEQTEKARKERLESKKSEK